ncbi:MAG TPA: ABC transporter substrate-binding protein [Acidimicrobiales bacterium]|nr:ABC transporter substrate-binding protein [Acidimicrobiales bacterium]
MTSGSDAGSFLERPLGRRQVLGLLASGGAGAVLAACSSPSSPSTTTTPPAPAGFPLGAAARASAKPVPITMWHSMTSANLTTITNLTNHFNASQNDVTVTLVNQNSYTDTLTAYTTALSGGTLPDLVQMETSDLQILIDSQSVVPAQSAVDAEHYDLSDFIPSTVEFFTVKGTLWAMPFNISSQVLYYDQDAFTAAGLDPASPPVTLDDLRSTAQKIISSGTEKYGMSLKVTDSTFQLLIALGGGDLVNHSNGRQGRATAVSFDDPLGKSVFRWWANMYADKLAQSTSGTTYDNLFAIANRIAPMTFDTSAAIGTILSVLDTYPKVKLGIGPLPATSAPGGGVFVGGAGLYMVSKSSPERQDAAWQFTKFLTDPAQQATWAVGTGYIPIRKSAASIPALAEAWQKVPGYRVAYEQILASPKDAATAGAVLGAFAQVSSTIDDAITSLASGADPNTALAQAASASNQDISSYNARV